MPGGETVRVSKRGGLDHRPRRQRGPGANNCFWHHGVLAARLGGLADPETVTSTQESDFCEFGAHPPGWRYRQVQRQVPTF